MDAISTTLEENGALIVWVLTEDDNRDLAGSDLSQNVFDDTIGSSTGIRVGDLQTLPTPGMFRDSPLRTGVGYIVGVRRGDMGVAFSADELSITPAEIIDAVIEAKNDSRTTAPYEGEKDFSNCEGGPFQTGEACACDDECVGASVCDNGICAPTCSSDDINCAGGLVCALSAQVGDLSTGVCRSDVGGVPAAASCSRDDDCAEGLCNVVPNIGRTVCQVICSADGDCENGYVCSEGSCSLSSDVGVACGEDNDDIEGEGNCQSSPLSHFAFFAMLTLALRRRARTIESSFDNNH